MALGLNNSEIVFVSICQRGKATVVISFMQGVSTPN